MELTDVILSRRSVRKYKDEDISEEKIKKILQAGILAPTSMNRKPCEFVVVRDKETLNKLAKSKKSGAGMLSECNTAIVVLANSEIADTWIEDSSIALSYMNLMAVNLGIGSCWCQIHLRSSATGKDAEENVREILSLSEKYRIVGILSLGIPLGEVKSQVLEEADFSKVHGWHEE
ncbi:MAG: nitroreductase family protein [Lachnospiraceae bacterium]|nr:nitroreductase family protein [Lachnospiraceae bacterium]